MHRFDPRARPRASFQTQLDMTGTGIKTSNCMPDKSVLALHVCMCTKKRRIFMLDVSLQEYRFSEGRHNLSPIHDPCSILSLFLPCRFIQTDGTQDMKEQTPFRSHLANKSTRTGSSLLLVMAPSRSSSPRWRARSSSTRSIPRRSR
jgi:hypothetical protein